MKADGYVYLRDECLKPFVSEKHCMVLGFFSLWLQLCIGNRLLIHVAAYPLDPICYSNRPADTPVWQLCNRIII